MSDELKQAIVDAVTDAVLNGYELTYDDAVDTAHMYVAMQAHCLEPE